MKKTALIALLLVGCNKPAPTQADKPKDQQPPQLAEKKAPASPFTAFADNAEIEKKWQGSWVVGKEAWQVEGTTVTVYDGKTEKKLALEVEAPCQAKLKEGSSWTEQVFAFDGN